MMRAFLHSHSTFYNWGFVEGNQAVQVVLQNHDDDERWKQRENFIRAESVHQQVKYDG
jgi:hypothetical protein